MGIPRRLQEFSVKLTANGMAYKSIIQKSPDGQGEGPFTPPIEQACLEVQRRELCEAISGCALADPDSPECLTPVHQGPVAFGDKLGAGFFQGEVALRLAGSLGALGVSEDGLRISLHLKVDDPQVAWLGELHWELLRREHRYFFLNPAYSLARCLDLPGPPAPTRLKQPLKVLVVVALPKGVTELDAGQDYGALKAAFRNSPSVEVEILEHASAKGLGDRLRQQAFHVVHFIGHCRFDSEQGKGLLFLETEEGNPDAVEAEIFADLLRGQITPRLVVLNACRTASFSSDRPWNGLAVALLNARIPAVVAMQCPISDPAAVAFSRGFYGYLAAGHGVDVAVAWGRQTIFLSDHHSLEWATPALWLRGMEGELFRVEAPRSPRRTVIIDVDREEPASPKSDTGAVDDRAVPYEDTLVNGLATFLDVAPTDLERVRTLGRKNRFKFNLPTEAADQLLKAATSPGGRFEWRRAELSISSIQAPQSWSSIAVTLAVGVLGNLLAAWLEKALLRDFFTLPRIISLLVLSFIFLRWDLFSRIRMQLGSRRVIATIIASAVLLACFALPAWLVRPKADCGRISRVELDLPSGAPLSLNLSGDRITDARTQDFLKIEHLSGRAVQARPDPQCVCEWSGRTDRDPQVVNLGSSADCSFTLDLPAQYDWIFLRLRVAGKTHQFTVQVH